MILGIIPARGGSRSIKDKNLVKLAGRPLIAYTIKTALKCKLLDKVIVSTENDRIAKAARRFGGEVLRRPARLAQDKTPMIAVMQHAVKAVEKQKQKVELIVLLDPTSPLRTTADIEKCIKKLRQSKADTVETVTEAEHNPIFIMGQVEADGRFKYLFPRQALRLTRRQDAPKIYRENAAVLVTTREMVMEKKQLFHGKLMAVIMPQERSVHIDNPIDLVSAESLITQKHE